MSESESAASNPQTSVSAPSQHPLDVLTGGVFSAVTSGERAQRLRAWLAANPAPEHMQAVYKELAAKDKGAAKPLREKLDELRRERSQEVVTDEWASRAISLLSITRLNIADALAWQRDAAKAGAPLSREPLAGLRARLVARVNQVEDLQKRASVQCEAAVLLAQRIELLSTKPWHNAQTARQSLTADVGRWRDQAQAIVSDAQWPSVDLRYPPQLEGAQGQLTAVWEAFESALDLTVTAAEDAAAPLPPVPVWADEIGRARSAAAAAAAAPEAAAESAKPARPKPAAPTPEQIAAATQAVEAGVMLLDQAVASGHTKNMHSATQALRQSLKTHGRLIDDTLAARVHAALVSAGELQGWQRWSADQLREQLVARAEALLIRRKVRKILTRSGERDAASASPAADDATHGPAGAPQPAQAAVDAVDVVAPAPEAPVADVSTDAVTADAPETAASQTDEADAPAPEPATAADSADESSADEARPDQPRSEESRPEEPKPDESKPDEHKAGSPADDLIPAFTGRKLQDAIRKLREEWKTADAGGSPNLALWKRFDRACNAAHRFVDAWLEKSRAETAQHKAQRDALIAEVQAWTAQQQAAGGTPDWKTASRRIHQFSDRWRGGGHVPESAFVALQSRWKAVIAAASAPLQAAQKESTARRHALIAEAQQLAQAVPLRIDAVKALQQRWQTEAQAVPLDRKHEQKLWDAFRKPIDEAFQKKSVEREKSQAATSAHDRGVLGAAKALEAANAAGDARQIRAAMTALEAALRGEAVKADDAPQAAAPVPASAPAAEPQTPATEAAPADAPAAPDPSDAGEAAAQPPASADERAGAEAAQVAQAAPEPVADDAAAETPSAESAPVSEAPPAAAPKPVKRLVAMRGDDRPGMKKADAKPEGRGKFGDRRDRDERGGGRFGDRGGRGADDRGPRRGDYRDDRRDGPRPPRLGDAAFRAQREALEHAQAALRKLAAQAHGEAVTGLVTAWQQRSSEALPAAPEFGRAVTPAIRTRWQQALTAAPVGDAAQALLRLEMAAETPTPAEHLDARRALQLTLLTRRNDPKPIDTWVQDTAAVLAAAHDDAAARRLQTVLKVLLRR